MNGLPAWSGWPPFPAIRTFFDEIVERSVTDKQRRGCMLVNSALELAPYDPEFQKIVAEEMIFIEAFFAAMYRGGAKGRHDLGNSPRRRTGQASVERSPRYSCPGEDPPAARRARRRCERCAGVVEDEC